MAKSKEAMRRYRASKGGEGGSSGGISGRNTPLQQGEPKTVSTYYSRGSFGGTYNDEALDAKFDAQSGTLSLDYASDKDWRDQGSAQKKRSHVDITVQNGIINGEPVNVNFASDSIKAVSAPKNLSDKSERMLRSNGFQYSSKSKTWEKGYKGFYSEGGTLHVDSALPSDLSKYTRIKGNTYDLRNDIKKAGFKWNDAEKSWDKK